jgi:hypothetical protein
LLERVVGPGISSKNCTLSSTSIFCPVSVESSSMMKGSVELVLNQKLLG